MDYKTCNRCQRSLPKDEIHYNKCKATKDKLHTICKECRGFKFGKSQRRSERQEIVNGTLKCNTCKKTLPATTDYFYKQSRKKNGFILDCKACMGHPYGVHKHEPEYKIENSVEMKKCNRCEIFYPHTKEFFNVVDGRLYTYCIECNKKFMRNYRKTDRGRLLHVIQEQKRRALVKNVPHNYSEEDWEHALNFWKDKDGNITCAYCGGVISRPQQEHIVPVSSGGGYEKHNIIPAGGVYECACNQSKGNKSMDNFFEYKDKFIKERYEKIVEFVSMLTECNKESII